MARDRGVITRFAGREAGSTRMRGFTSVRDLAGSSLGLERAIDEGLVPGRGIWPSGAMISPTSGRDDPRMRSAVRKAAAAPHDDLIVMIELIESPARSFVVKDGRRFENTPHM